MRIAVLLATYQGEMYIRAQLDSLLKGRRTDDLCVYVRDDRSRDNTLRIVHQYKERYVGKIEIIENKGVNLGSTKSFLELLNRVEADYYFLCDQDDVWMDDKVEAQMKEILGLESQHGGSNPALVFSDLTVVDNDLNVKYPSMWKVASLNPKWVYKWKLLTVQNVVTGCTICMNRAARNLVIEHENPGLFHDHHIAILVSKQGVVEYVRDPLVLYRQHSSNVEGVRPVRLKYVLSKVLSFRVWLKTYRQVCKVYDISLAEVVVTKAYVMFLRLWYRVSK